MCPHVGEDVGHSLRTHGAKQTLRDLAAGKVLPAVPHHKFAQLVAIACPGLPHGARCAHGRPYRWHQRNDRPFADVMRVCVHELGTTGEAAAGDRLLRSYGWSDSAKETIVMF